MTHFARLICEAFNWQCNVLEYGDNVEVSLNGHIYSFYDKTAEEIIEQIKTEQNAN